MDDRSVKDVHARESVRLESIINMSKSKLNISYAERGIWKSIIKMSKSKLNISYAERGILLCHIMLSHLRTNLQTSYSRQSAVRVTAPQPTRLLLDAMHGRIPVESVSKPVSVSMFKLHS